MHAPGFKCFLHCTQVVSSLQLDPVPRGGRPPCVPLRLFVRRGGRSAYLSSYEDISFTSRPVEAQAPDGAGVSLRQALLPLVAECLASAGGGSDVELEQGRASAVPTSSSSSIRVEVGGHEQRQEQQQAESGRDGSLPSMPGVVAGSGGSEAEGDGAAVGSPSVGTKAAAAVEAVGTNSEGGALAAAEAAITEVVVAGISPPLEAPLLWLHSQLASADQFLYIVVHCKD